MPFKKPIKTSAYSKKEFTKAQIAAIIGTTVDYLFVIGLKEIVDVWYVYANLIGASFGAITNFLLGRYWAFKSDEDNMTYQAFRYAIVAIGSVILNTLGLYGLTEYFSFHYIIAKIIIAITVAVTYNYLLQKYFVFRK